MLTAGGAAIGYGTGYGTGKGSLIARIEGEITKVDVAQGRVAVRQSDVGGRVDAKLREAPNC